MDGAEGRAAALVQVLGRHQTTVSRPKLELSCVEDFLFLSEHLQH